MLRIVTVLLFFGLGFLAPNTSFGQSNTGSAKAGLLGGYIVPDADNTKPRRLWGVLGSSMLSKSWSVGGYYLTADQQVGTAARDFKFSIHGLSLKYHVLAGKGDSFYGIRAGLTKIESNDGAGNKFTFSPYHWGVVAGYDYTTLSWLSVGFECSYLQFDDSITTATGTTYTEDSFNGISFSVTTKISF